MQNGARNFAFYELTFVFREYTIRRVGVPWQKGRNLIVRVLTKTRLRDFWRLHPNAETPLNSWYKTVERAKWSVPLDVRETYRIADPVGREFVVFDICNNDYRLIVRVDYKRGIVYVWKVLTHADYNKLDLKKIDQRIEREKKGSH
jgi:mRNA interferase HigB